MDKRKQNNYDNLIAQYSVDLSSLEPLRYKFDDKYVYVEHFRVLTETLERKYLLSEVEELINNAISSEMIKVRDRMDELKDDLIK